MPKHIRPVAICVFRRNDDILVIEAFDSVKSQTFYRPLGGGIEFGETSAAAVAREVREEVGAEISQLRYLGALENIFTYEGAPGHEIVHVHEGWFLDRALYAKTRIIGAESDGTPFRALWKPLESFSSVAPLYPDGLKELLLSSAVQSDA
jgi:8-oxo-dGTP pyrophosphatase MutT (NUDIX family)